MLIIIICIVVVALVIVAIFVASITKPEEKQEIHDEPLPLKPKPQQHRKRPKPQAIEDHYDNVELQNEINLNPNDIDDPDVRMILQTVIDDDPPDDPPECFRISKFPELDKPRTKGSNVWDTLVEQRMCPECKSVILHKASNMLDNTVIVMCMSCKQKYSVSFINKSAKEQV